MTSSQASWSQTLWCWTHFCEWKGLNRQNVFLKNVSCSVEDIIIQWAKPFTVFCSSSHLCIVFAVITYCIIGAKDQGYSECESTNLPAFIAKLSRGLFTSVYLFFGATQHRQLGCTLKWHEIKTISADQWRSEYFDRWCMSEVMGQTVSGSQEVNQMCTRRNRH